MPEGVEGPRIDAGGRAVIPGFVDSHTHLVFVVTERRSSTPGCAVGSYAAGGIQSTVEATSSASDDDLRANARRLAHEALRSGTTHLEIKSGYALQTVPEQRLLTLAGELTDDTTFLGAHVVPPDWAHDPDGYVDHVRGPMLDVCAPLAKWADVFCEQGAFDEDQSRAVLVAARDRGLGSADPCESTRPRSRRPTRGGARCGERGSRDVPHRR